jgi:D-serine deaminase-like pyridoxal phosphate-dependent protein
MEGDIHTLFTPCLILDEAIMQRNIDKVADRAAQLNVTLRPHFKTPKSIDVVRRLLARQAQGITVSTLREAAFLASQGIDDIFYAAELPPQKTEPVCRLIHQGVDLKCLTDSLPAIREINQRAAGKAVIPFLIALDTDGYRCGLQADDPALYELAEFIDQADNLIFSGIMAYAGGSYKKPTLQSKGALAESQRLAALAVQAKLEKQGIPCRTISFGSTPAWTNASTMEGMSECRGGIYVFQDLFQAGAGHCAISDIALSVLTTVVSIQADRNRFFVDAGGLALSKDRSTAGYDFDAGFGLVCDARTCTPMTDLYVEDTHQEHGVVTSRSGQAIDFDHLQVGSMVRILPNHSDMTAAAFDEYYVVESNTKIKYVWPRVNGWSPSVK